MTLQSHKLGIFLGILAGLSACSGSETTSTAAAAIDAGDADAPQPVPDSGAVLPYDPASIYDMDSLRNVVALEITILGDVVHAEAGGRFVRELTFGYAGSGFPTSNSIHDAGAHIFIESNAAGVPIGDTDALALHLLDGSEAGVTTDCALLTGHPCAIALHNLLSPGRFSPTYPNVYRDPVGPIEDSNELYVNLLAEMREGVDAYGTQLTGPPAQRIYEVQIATERVRLLSAIGRVMVEQGLSAAPPSRYVIAGHSKWGAAAAQLAAIDDRLAIRTEGSSSGCHCVERKSSRV